MKTEQKAFRVFQLRRKPRPTRLALIYARPMQFPGAGFLHRIKTFFDMLFIKSFAEMAVLRTFILGTFSCFGQVKWTRYVKPL